MNILLKVILVSLIVSSPAIILTIEMYLYERYKKWKNTEVQEKEKIILGKANKIVSQDEELQRQADEKKKLELELDLLNIRKKSLQEELNISDVQKEDIQDDEIDLSDMSIKQLHEVAKKQNIKRYSKLKKKQLLALLQK